jgi:hypothetical protein
MTLKGKVIVIPLKENPLPVFKNSMYRLTIVVIAVDIKGKDYSVLPLQEIISLLTRTACVVLMIVILILAVNNFLV